MSSTILNMPKIDLHCHLDGSLPIECVSELAERRAEAYELQVDEACTNLAEYLKKFNLPLAYLQNEKNLKKASKQFLTDLKKDNICYVEVRFAQLLSVNENLNCSQVLEAVIAGLEEGKKETGIYYNVIACAMRHHNPEDSLNMFKICREYLGNEFVQLTWQEMKQPIQ